MMYVCYGYVDDVMVKQLTHQIMYVCYGYVDDVMVKQLTHQIMYVCYGYVDDVMVKQVAVGVITSSIISPSAVSTMFQSSSFLNVSRNTKKLYFQLLTTK